MVLYRRRICIRPARVVGESRYLPPIFNWASSLDQADAVGLIGQDFLCAARDHASYRLK
jgi:hypothetical protein